MVHRPAVVVAATSAADVAAAVGFARAEGLAIAVQATGHGAAAVADDTVLVSTGGCGASRSTRPPVARVQAGVRWRAVIDAAVPHGLAPLSGSSSGVGVVGYTLGGGMGLLARRHGFAADHVRSAELVTPAGEIRTVTAQNDPELFWAVRGGQSRFGIVTALEFGLVPVPEFFGGAMLFTADAVEEVLHAWAAWAPSMPEEVTTWSRCCGCRRSTACRRRCAASSASPCGSVHRLTGGGGGVARPDPTGRRARAGLRRPDVLRRRGRDPHGPSRPAAGRDAWGPPARDAR